MAIEQGFLNPLAAETWTTFKIQRIENIILEIEGHLHEKLMLEQTKFVANLPYDEPSIE